MESYISGLKYGDFATVSADVLGSFKSCDAYKSVEKNIQVQELLVGDEFKNALTTNISESIANTIINDGKYMTVMQEIKTQALEKAQNGDFDVNGALDTQTAINWLVEQVTIRLAEFYPNGFGDMSLDELNLMYDKLVESADKQDGEEKQLEARRDAAIEYCKALSEKSTKFAEIVKDAFGDNYASAINKMYPTDINNIIEELKVKAEELGDANELTLVDSTWSSVPNGNIVVSPGNNKTFTITPTFTDKEGASKLITSDRITYKSSNTALLDVDSNGKVTVNGTTNGTFTANVTILVDGVEVGEKTVTVKVVTSSVDWASMSNVNVNGVIARDGAARGSNGNITLQEAYNNSACLILNGSNGEFTRDWNGTIANAKTKLADFVNGTLCSSIRNTGNFDEQALQIAAQKTIELYQAALTQINNGDMAGKKSNKDSIINYDGENYTFRTQKWYREATAANTGCARSHSAANNQLGLQLNESYNSPNTYQVVLNMRCIMDMFNKFYAKALS